VNKKNFPSSVDRVLGLCLLHLAMHRVMPAEPAKFLQLHPGSRLFLVLGSRIVPVLAIGTL
jgi:hypothetical protein